MASKKKKVQSIDSTPRNFVHKNMNTFNHSVVMVDRKKESKNCSSRKMKHKKGPMDLF